MKDKKCFFIMLGDLNFLNKTIKKLRLRISRYAMNDR